MFNLNAEIFESPIPHLIVRDFVTDKKTLDYLRHNTESNEYLNRIDAGNLERFEVVSGKHLRSGQLKYWKTSSYRHPVMPTDDFSIEFNSIIDEFLITLLESHSVDKMVKSAFDPVLKQEFEKFDEDWNDPKFKNYSYGAYNACTSAKNIIGWHLDNGDKYVVGFCYFKEESDAASDGRLSLSNGETEKIFPIEDNVLILWPNLTNAWHKAGIRYPTNNLRRLVNLTWRSSSRKYHDYKAIRSNKVVDKNELYDNKEFGFKKVNKI